MPCYHPLQGYRSQHRNASGKRSIVFNYNEGYKDQPVTLPCGQCIGCRLEKSRDWAIRCHHEAKIHEKNCFITLTYDEENLPYAGTLVKSHYQGFMKRLRAWANEDRKKRLKEGKPLWTTGPIRYFHCGEYGEKRRRPHYHACLFNWDFEDKIEVEKSHAGEKQWESQTLNQLWGHGITKIGSVTFESAAYVARYITKKITGRDAELAYSKVNKKTGEIVEIQPEYVTMSRRPGIGKPWYEKFKTDVFPMDQVILRGIAMGTPKFYRNQLEREKPEMAAKVKAKRSAMSEKQNEENSWRRLQDKEEIQWRKAQQLKRKYENEK